MLPELKLAVNWRKPECNAPDTSCIHMARTDDGQIAIAESYGPANGAVLTTPALFADYAAAIKRGEFDEFTQ